MTEIEQLRAEVEDLRIVATKLLPMAIVIACTASTSADAARETAKAWAQIRAAEKSDLFADTAVKILLGIVSRAALQHPQDAELQQLLADMQQRH